MLALYRAGRAGGGARRLPGRARPRSTSSASSPGEELRRLQGEILRDEARPSRRANGHGADRDADAEVVKALARRAASCPVLGLDGGD